MIISVSKTRFVNVHVFLKMYFFIASPSNTFAFCLMSSKSRQRFSTLVIRDPPVLHVLDLSMLKLIHINGCYQASVEVDNDPFIRIKCVGAGNHLKYAERSFPDDQC